MKAYIVYYAPYNIEVIDSVWTDKKLAQTRLDELHATAG